MEERTVAASAYVYMMRCANGALYTGWTNDLLRRLRTHAGGKGAKYTRGFGGETLAYAELLEDKGAALRREAALKKCTKEEKEALAAGFDPARFVLLRPARPADAEAVLGIYSHYVLNSTASFLYQPPKLEDYRKEMRGLCRKLPFFLAENALGQPLGYACAHPWRYGTGAYAWDTETTIYLAPEARRLGVGSMLYHALLAALCRLGYWNAYAVLADPNPASEAFHERFGFVCEGRQARCGLKNGWQGVSYWLMDLAPGRTDPPEAEPRAPLPGELAALAAGARRGADWREMAGLVQPEEDKEQ